MYSRLGIERVIVFYERFLWSGLNIARFAHGVPLAHVPHI